MAKASGGTRSINKTTKSIDENRREYDKYMLQKDVSRENSYFSEKTGAYVISYKGRNAQTADVEKEAAKILADNGYIVEMTPESGDLYITNYIKGKPKYADGKISGVLYEQKTPHPTTDDLASSVNNAIEHAMSKKANVAVIYDKYASYHRNDIKDGIERFNENHNYKFKGIITINAKGEIHEWTQ